jgi:hypothetical protein
MSRVGRTLFFLAILSSFLTTSVQASNSCLTQTLSSLFEKKPESLDEIVNGLREYNDLIRNPLTNFVPAETRPLFDYLLTRFEKIDSTFPRTEFLEWYKANPITLQEFKALQKKKLKFGDLLKQKVEEFHLVHPPAQKIDFDQLADEIMPYLKSIGKECGENVTCHQNRIGKFLSQKLKMTCLGNNPKAATSLLINLAIANAGLAVSFATQKEEKSFKSFPYEYFINNLVWTFPLSEIGCRNSLGKKPLGKVGEKIELQKHYEYLEGHTIGLEHQTYSPGWLKKTSRAYGAYMLWSPLNEATYMAMHIAAEKKLRDHEVNTDPSHLARELTSYMIWDAALAVPRTVLILDPLYLKHFPKAQPVLDRLFKDPAAAQKAYAIGEGLVRWGVAWGNKVSFSAYEDQANVILKELDEKSESRRQPPKTQTSSSSKPSLTIAPHHQKVPTLAARPAQKSERAIQKPSEPVKTTCDRLSDTYLKCSNSKECGDVHDTYSKAGTATCSACVAQLDAYESECGAFWTF